MEVTEELLNHIGHYNIVWDHVEPVKDQVAIRASVRAGDVLIGTVDDDVVTVQV